ncbi:MAG TPA: sugar transferase [Prolixibacteraceae bacterium]
MAGGAIHVKTTINNVKPGLTGIGSISESSLSPQEFYRLHIAPYKGELELWYQKHLSFYTDFMLMFLTAWAILVPKSNLVYVVFKDLPKRPVIMG